MSAGRFVHSCENNQLHHILTSISNLFRQLISTPPDLEHQNTHYPG